MENRVAEPQKGEHPQLETSHQFSSISPLDVCIGLGLHCPLWQALEKRLQVQEEADLKNEPKEEFLETSLCALIRSLTFKITKILDQDSSNNQAPSMWTALSNATQPVMLECCKTYPRRAERPLLSQ